MTIRHQGQILNNFISGSAGGLVGTVLNTPYVRPITPSDGNANWLLSSLLVSTSAAQFVVCTAVFQTDSLHTGCQVSDPGSRESIGSCPEIQLDISCVCFFSVNISCDNNYLTLLLVRRMTISVKKVRLGCTRVSYPKYLGSRQVADYCYL
jgi:hypothetical protein